MKRLQIVALGACLCALFACENGSITAPSPPPTTPPTTPDPDPFPIGRPEPVYPGPPEMGEVLGVISFGVVTPLEGQTHGEHFQYVKSYCERCLAAGFNTMSIGSEMSSWPGGGSYLRRGPPIYSAQWQANLTRTIEAAGAGGCWVQLVVVLTIKESHHFPALRKYTQRVMDLTQHYPHIYYEAVNEWYIHSTLSLMQAVRLVDLLKRSGKSVVLSDSGLRVGRRILAIVTDPAVHPARNPDPTVSQLREAKQLYRPRLLLNETTCYASDAELATYGLWGRGTIAMNGRGTEAQRRDQILIYIRHVKEANNQLDSGGLRFFFHHLAGLEGTTLDWWIPYWREQ